MEMGAFILLISVVGCIEIDCKDYSTVSRLQTLRAVENAELCKKDLHKRCEEKQAKNTKLMDPKEGSQRRIGGRCLSSVLRGNKSPPTTILSQTDALLQYILAVFPPHKTQNAKAQLLGLNLHPTLEIVVLSEAVHATNSENL